MKDRGYDLSVLPFASLGAEVVRDRCADPDRARLASMPETAGKPWGPLMHVSRDVTDATLFAERCRQASR